MKNNYILFKERNTQHRIKIESILFVRTNDHVTKMFAGKSIFNFNTPLQELLEDPNFKCLVQIHRCFAVNIHQVTAINRTEIFIEHIRLPIGRNFSETVHKAFLNTT
ncbi:LytTR family DNA-binding domain-containing protein [Flavihumibacter fluvii]|uniref:LytTR family DNA-binding domain-containing protein n=1 Tax=Flavihumibacter fluvii TaxID=2838157 RepID=UPI001BDE63C0|nr:LytTR family DNA-binding domain-containing protein [Flavihumibacter fluvii]